MQIEKAVLDGIAELPVRVRELIEPPPRKSRGLTLAMWAQGPHGPWRDLTGRDPTCRSSAQFPECGVFYGPVQEASAWLASQLERPDDEPAFAELLNSQPLTSALAIRLMPSYRRDEAVQAAVERGYPLAPELTKPG